MQTVTFMITVRNIGDDFAAECGKPLDQQCRGCDAIGIEVAIDGYFLAGKQSLVSPAHGLMYVRQEERISFQPAVSVQEGLDLGRLADASIVKQPNHQWINPRYIKRWLRWG